jgi:membrane peptidoglycan carboxypeptidase
MQLVKNVFLRREKTLARKVQEVLLTWWVESTLTKEQILELYLNVIEYGPGVYGIRNAAGHYFGRSPAELSVAEAAYLAMILPNPPRFHEHFEAGSLPPSFRRRTERFATLLHERGRIDADGLAQALEELGAFRFAIDGARVGPDVLRGTAATLPIPGFSGSPGLVLDETTGTEPLVEDEDAAEDEDAGWEETWP